MNKRGVELAINNLVIIILMLVMMGVGFLLFYNLKNKVEKLNYEVANQLKDDIIRQMGDSGSRVFVPFLVQYGKRDDYVEFVIGIENIYDVEHNFKLAETHNASLIQPLYITQNKDITIKAHERGFSKIFYKIPKGTRPGQWTYTLDVCYNVVAPEVDTGPDECDVNYNSYGTLQKIYVVVR